MRDFVKITENRREVLIRVDTIVYLESEKRKVNVFTTMGVHECYNKLCELSEDLGDSFLCCHRSFAINMDHIIAMKNGKIEFVNNMRIDLGRDTYARTKKAVVKYFKKKEEK